MLRIHSLSKSFGADPVLQDVSFSLGSGERAGLVGPNGSGKSTLLRLLAGEMRPDAGSIWVDPNDRVTYLPQYPLDELHLSVHDALLRGAGRLGDLSSRVATLERLMASARGEDLDTLLGQYARAQQEFEALGGYGLEARMEEVVSGLALQAPNLEVPVASLSGGNKTKLSLARLLLSGASILLLDEPTNYLDLPAVLWLERTVCEGNRSYIIVSHDRRFLDRTVNTILELDGVKHSLRIWPGTYSDFERGRHLEEAQQLEAYRDQQERISRVERDIRQTKEQARKVESNTHAGLGADVQRRRAKKVARKAKARERRLERALEEETIEKPRQNWGLHLVDLTGQALAGDRQVLEVQDLWAGYGQREVLRGLDLLVRGADRIALLGENGSGKSTLLRCIAGEVPFRGHIRLGPSVRLGMLSQEGTELPLQQPVLEVFRSRTAMYEDDARTYLHKFLFTAEDVFKPVESLSYGQRAKLSLALLVLSGANVLLLDEPTSHLDMPALEAMEEALADYTGPLLLVSHDRSFIEAVGVNRVVVVHDGRLHTVDGVDAYEHELRRGAS